MNLKNKIIPGALCVLIAGIGIFGISESQSNVARAQNATTATASIDQLQQLVNSLIQQIQQLFQQIAYWKPLETCGNGICRFGETATSCPADCATTVCGKTYGLTYAADQKSECAAAGGNVLATHPPCPANAKCAATYSCNCNQITQNIVCGNGICEAGENNFCPACTKSVPACMIACTKGTCPQDCGATDADKLKCAGDNGCIASCSYGCVAKSWYSNSPRVDCMALPNYSCQCSNGNCAKKTTASCQKEGAFCGGIAAGSFPCCGGLTCKLNGTYPDAGGTCATMTKSVCGNNTCETGETAANCARDCGTTTTCYGEGQGEIVANSGTTICCAGLTAKWKTTTTCSGTICSTQEGFICSK